MFSLIGTLVIGFLAGLVARIIKPGDDSMGTIATTLLIVGAFVGQQGGQLTGMYEAEQPPASWPRSSARSSCCSL